jgi:hypothetical protein
MNKLKNLQAIQKKQAWNILVAEQQERLYFMVLVGWLIN